MLKKILFTRRIVVLSSSVLMTFLISLVALHSPSLYANQTNCPTIAVESGYLQNSMVTELRISLSGVPLMAFGIFMASVSINGARLGMFLS